MSLRRENSKSRDRYMNCEAAYWIKYDGWLAVSEPLFPQIYLIKERGEEGVFHHFSINSDTHG